MTIHLIWLKSFLVSLVGRFHLPSAIKLYGIFSKNKHGDCLGCIKCSLGTKEALAKLPCLTSAVKILSEKPNEIFLNLGFLEDVFSPEGPAFDYNLRALSQTALFYRCNFVETIKRYEIILCPVVESKKSLDGSFELVAGEVWTRPKLTN